MLSKLITFQILAFKLFEKRRGIKSQESLFIHKSSLIELGVKFGVILINTEWKQK